MMTDDKKEEADFENQGENIQGGHG